MDRLRNMFRGCFGIPASGGYVRFEESPIRPNQAVTRNSSASSQSMNLQRQNALHSELPSVVIPPLDSLAPVQNLLDKNFSSEDKDDILTTQIVKVYNKPKRDAQTIYTPSETSGNLTPSSPRAHSSGSNRTSEDSLEYLQNYNLGYEKQS